MLLDVLSWSDIRTRRMSKEFYLFIAQCKVLANRVYMLITTSEQVQLLALISSLKIIGMEVNAYSLIWLSFSIMRRAKGFS